VIFRDSILPKINQYFFKSFFFSITVYVSIKIVPIQKKTFVSVYYSYRFILDNVILFHPMSVLISMPRI